MAGAALAGGSPALRNAMAASMAARCLPLIITVATPTQESSPHVSGATSPAGDALMSQVTTLSAKELQRRGGSWRSVAPAQKLWSQRAKRKHRRSNKS